MEDQNKNNLHNQDDVNPTTQLDQIVNDDGQDNLPETNGTGSNRPVPTSGTVIVKEGADEEDHMVKNNPEQPEDNGD